MAILAHLDTDLLGPAGRMFTTVLIFAVADQGPVSVHVDSGLLRPGSANPWVVDIGVVLFLAGSMVGAWHVIGGDLFPARIEAVLTAVILGALLVRSRIPFSVLCVTSVAVFLWILASGRWWFRTTDLRLVRAALSR